MRQMSKIRLYFDHQGKACFGEEVWDIVTQTEKSYELFQPTQTGGFEKHLEAHRVGVIDSLMTGNIDSENSDISYFTYTLRNKANISDAKKMLKKKAIAYLEKLQSKVNALITSSENLEV